MIRATNHNRRIAGQRQTHNDRNFNTARAGNIDPSLTGNNVTMTCYSDNLTFDEAEKRFYTETIGRALQEQNEKYIRSGHRERCKTIDEYRTAPQTCPEETLYYLGKKSDPDKATARELMQVYNEYHEWHKRTFPLIARLDVALHRDEPNSADHIHERKVYLAHKNGKLIVSQTQCFAELGIQRPDPSKPQNRYNNPKMTYSKMCRDAMIAIAQAHGIEVETEPQEASKSGLAHYTYMREQEEAKIKKLEQALAERKRDNPRASRLQRLFNSALNDPIIDNHPNR